MANENEFLFYALLMGIYITFLYDILRIFRRVFPHGSLLVSLEDMAFWIYCAVKVFLLMYYESNGTLRWFAVFGAMTGMLLYLKLVSPFFVKYSALVLRKLVAALLGAGIFLFRPVCRMLKRLCEQAGRAAQKRAVRLQKKSELCRRIWKKKLTFLKKMLKITHKEGKKKAELTRRKQK